MWRYSPSRDLLLLKKKGTDSKTERREQGKKISERKGVKPFQEKAGIPKQHFPISRLS
jgi:hypothetical protein